MRACPLLLGALGATLLACDASGDSGAAEPPGRDVAASAPVRVTGGSPPPAHPARFGIGRPASAAALRAMDRDVGEEGRELPAGRGTVAEGRALFAAQCAVCHGANGQGMPPAFPALSGRDPKAEDFAFATDPKLVHTIGNYWPHATTLFDYIRRAMPLTAPGSLTDDQVYALSAYLLAVDRIIPDTATLDAARLRQVRMPYRDRFVPDDRRPANAGR